MSNWAEMIPEILSMICKRVDSFEGLVAFGGVCSTWRHVAVEHNMGKPLLPFLWLMLAEHQDDDFRDFYSVTEGETYSFELPELRGKKCMETKGWIVTSSSKGEMALVHPLTRVHIPLPHQNTSKIYDGDYGMEELFFVRKAVLSSPPDPKNERDCVLMILHGGIGHIGFCRPGDGNWTVIEFNFKSAIQSLEYYRGKFYVATLSGEVGEYDVIGKSNDTGSVLLRRIEVNFREYCGCRQSYLVESAGSLLVVIRNGIHSGDYGTSEFWVLEMDVDKGGYKDVTSLGTRTIFLGHSATLSVDTIWYPELIPNSIYFTDDCFEAYFSQPEGGGTNMGIYNLEDKSMQPHFVGKSLSLICPPVWTFLTIKL